MPMKHGRTVLTFLERIKEQSRVLPRASEYRKQPAGGQQVTKIFPHPLAGEGSPNSLLHPIQLNRVICDNLLRDMFRDFGKVFLDHRLRFGPGRVGMREV